jgi:putative oxidoreductase
VVELLGGLAILIGFRRSGSPARSWSICLSSHCSLITFWLQQGAAREVNQMHFYKNLAIIGGFLLFAIMGAGRYLVDT